MSKDEKVIENEVVYDAREKYDASMPTVDKIVIPDDTRLVGKALRLQETIITNDPYNDPDFNREIDAQTG